MAPEVRAAVHRPRRPALHLQPLRRAPPPAGGRWCKDRRVQSAGLRDLAGLLLRLLGLPGCAEEGAGLQRQVLGNERQTMRPGRGGDDPICRIVGKTRRAISLRINETVLEYLRQRAAEEGLPCQTPVSSVLHRFSSGGLVDAHALRQALEAMKQISPRASSEDGGDVPD